MKQIVVFLLFLFPFMSWGQGPRVPSRMTVAGVDMKLTDAAKKDIQGSVDALTRSPKYFNTKVQRANMHFPIIERVFKEENFPDDIKYLVLQESALIPDAVSSSNAVGYWQFKKSSGEEVGLRIDRQVDERMNIVSATRAAAKYMKKSNLYFKNYIYAIQAYNQGPTGALKHTNKKNHGQKKMTINRHTHWYVKKFLAHKVAFKDAVKTTNPPTVWLHEYTQGKGKTMQQIAKELDVDQTELKEYNKWLKTKHVPSDKPYTVIVPLPADKRKGIKDNLIPLAMQNTKNIPSTMNSPHTKEKHPSLEYNVDSKRAYLVKVNGIMSILSDQGDDLQSITEKGNMSIRRFLKINDMSKSDEIKAGLAYYLSSKRKKAKVHYYTAHPGETLWSISQQFGIKLRSLMFRNRIKSEKELKPGRVLWMRYVRPKTHPIEYQKYGAEDKPGFIIKGDPPQKMLQQPAETTSKLNLLERESTPPDKTYYLVKPGDTMYKIANSHGVSIEELMKWNKKKEANLAVGEKLLIRELKKL